MFQFKVLIFLLPLLQNISGQFRRDDDPDVAEKNLYLVQYKDSLDNYDSVSFADIESILGKDDFDTNKTTVIYIPGVAQDLNAKTSVIILDSYLNKTDDFNIFQLNYTYYSKRTIPEAFLATDLVGQVTAKALNQLIDAGLPIETIQLIGHSLGAQVAGAIGRHSEQLLPIIVGLDPAGPGFNVVLPHLQKGDASYVATIHTDLGVYGTRDVESDVDYFPNGGVRFQPGCPRSVPIPPLNERDVCSHHYSVKLWASIIQNGDLFLAVKCHRTVFGRLRCDKKNPAEITTESRVLGKYYFKTSGEAPYGLGKDGIQSL